MQMRTERYPQESRLITELRNIQQHSYSRVLRPSASHRADGYTSDTTHFADDDDDQEDFTIPLHINTTTSPTHKLNSVGSAPASPLLPNRTSSRRYYGTGTTSSHPSSSASYLSGVTGPLGRQKSDSSFDRERPFVAVKRAHEQSRKFKETQVSAVNQSWIFCMTWENVAFMEVGVVPTGVFRILHIDELCGMCRLLSIVSILVIQ